MHVEPTAKQRKALKMNASKDSLNDIIEKVLLRKSLSITQKIDRLLLFDHTLHGELDVDHTVHDKKKIMIKSRIIYRGIKRLDKKLGETFLIFQDDD